MKHVSQLITQPLPEFVEQTTSRPMVTEDKSSKAHSAEREDAMLKRLWERMTEIYGHRWLSSYGETVNDSWLRGLRNLTGQQIGQGLTRLLDRDSEWPPSLPEFRVLCLTDPNAPLHASHRPAPKLLGAPSNPERALSAIAECRQILGMPSRREFDPGRIHPTPEQREAYRKNMPSDPAQTTTD